MLGAASCVSRAQEEAAVLVTAAYKGRVAHVETVGVLYNGKEEVGSGSGLLLGNKYVLTNNHVIPHENNFKTLVIQVRLGSRLVSPKMVAAVHRDAGRDLALIELVSPVTDAPLVACPMPVARSTEDVQEGTRVYVLGFPLNEEVGVSSGLLSTHSASGGRWRTDTLITYGHSGGPAFDGKGTLIGVAVGGVGKFTVGGETRDVDGINFLIPATKLRESDLMKTITAIPQSARCWSDMGSHQLATKVAWPARLARTFTVSETKDDHPVVLAPHSRLYERRFAAEPGYHVESCNFQSTSANKVGDETCNVSPGGKEAIFNFRLTSGPSIDRYRGWWAGTVTVTQKTAPELPVP